MKNGVLIFCLLGLSCFSCKKKKSVNLPNIIVILTDDQRWTSLAQQYQMLRCAHIIYYYIVCILYYAHTPKTTRPQRTETVGAGADVHKVSTITSRRVGP